MSIGNQRTGFLEIQMSSEKTLDIKPRITRDLIMKLYMEYMDLVDSVSFSLTCKHVQNNKLFRGTLNKKIEHIKKGMSI